MQWEQAKLPVSMGGAGLRAAADHAQVAFATSYLASQTLVADMLGHGADAEPDQPDPLPQPLLDAISARQGDEATTESLTGVTQKMASLKIDQQNQLLLLNYYSMEGDVREIARLASVGLQHAGDWLSVNPNPALGLHLRGPEFTLPLKYRLGIPLSSTPGTCPACSQPADAMGDHALSCSHYGDRIARHDLVRDILYEAASSAGLGPTKEAPHLLPNSAARPGDIFLRHWSRGKDAALDVTITSPLAASNMQGAAEEAGSSLRKAFERKLRGAAEVCREQGLAFIPVAMETFGGLHTAAIDQLKQLGVALARRTGQEDQEATRHLFQRVSLNLMKGNAALFLARSLDEDQIEARVDGRE